MSVNGPSVRKCMDIRISINRNSKRIKSIQSFNLEPICQLPKPQWGGVPTPRVMPAYYSTKFPHNCMKMKKIRPRRRRASKISLCRSTTANVFQIFMNVNIDNFRKGIVSD